MTNPLHYPARMIRKDPGGVQAAQKRTLDAGGLIGRYVTACSPWCGECSRFVGAVVAGLSRTPGSCPGVFSRDCREAPVCLVRGEAARGEEAVA